MSISTINLFNIVVLFIDISHFFAFDAFKNNECRGCHREFQQEMCCREKANQAICGPSSGTIEEK